MGRDILLSRQGIGIAVHRVFSIAAQGSGAPPGNGKRFGGVAVIDNENGPPLELAEDPLQPGAPCVGKLHSLSIGQIIEYPRQCAAQGFHIEGAKELYHILFPKTDEDLLEFSSLPGDDSQGQGIEELIGQDHPVERFYGLPVIRIPNPDRPIMEPLREGISLVRASLDQFNPTS